MTTTLMIHAVTSYKIEEKYVWSGGMYCPYTAIEIEVDGKIYGDITLFHIPTKDEPNGHDTNE